MVITVSTRNRVASKIARGFESHRLRQIKTLAAQGFFSISLYTSTHFHPLFFPSVVYLHIHITQNENAKKSQTATTLKKMIAFFPFLWYNEVNHHNSGMELYNEKIFDLVSLDA